MGEENMSGLVVSVIVGLTFTVILVIALWKVFVKAGKPGWAAIIPFYNTYILLKIAGKPGWWLLLFFIPFGGIVVSLLIALGIAKAFKRSALFGIIMLWLLSGIGYLILGFGKSVYSGASAPAVPTGPLTPPTPATPPPPIQS